jgi:hypothetical protein
MCYGIQRGMSHEGEPCGITVPTPMYPCFFVVCLFVCYATESIITSGKGEIISVFGLAPYLEGIWRRSRYTVTYSLLWLSAGLLPGQEPPGAEWIDGCGGPRSCCGRVGEGQYFLSLQSVQADSGACPAFCLDGTMGISGLKAEVASSWSIVSVYCRWIGILLFY